MSSGYPTINDTAPGTTNRRSVPKDVPSAKQVLRNAALSSAGRVRFATTSTQADEVGALATLAGSTDVVSAQDIVLFTGLSGYTADGTPTWGELVTALSS